MECLCGIEQPVQTTIVAGREFASTVECNKCHTSAFKAIICECGEPLRLCHHREVQDSPVKSREVIDAFFRARFLKGTNQYKLLRAKYFELTGEIKLVNDPKWLCLNCNANEMIEYPMDFINISS